MSDKTRANAGGFIDCTFAPSEQQRIAALESELATLRAANAEMREAPKQSKWAIDFLVDIVNDPEEERTITSKQAAELLKHIALR